MAKPSKKKQSEDSVVQPLIREEGKPHALETLFEGKAEDMPILKSVGYAPLQGGPNQWVGYTIHSRGKEIIKIEVGEPNLRAIAEDDAKMAFVTHLMDQGI